MSTVTDAEPEQRVCPMSQVRDVQAMNRFELFLFSAVATILIVRSALAATGYPQVGGSSGLHVAHVLYGGLLMGIAIVMVQIVPGTRTRVRAAFIGGIGFGLFLDEVGKFLTKDVNYFFKPAVTVMYAVFVLFYIVVREVLEHRRLNDARRMAMAANAAADLALGQLDERARDRARTLLDDIRSAELAVALRSALSSEHPCGARRVDRVGHRLGDRAQHLLRSSHFRGSVGVLLVLQLLGSAAELALILIQPSIGKTHGSHVTDVGAVIATTVSLVYVAFGMIRWRRHDLRGALHVLTRSAGIALLFTQLFVFTRYEWSGLIGFFLQALLLAALRITRQALRDDPELSFQEGTGSLVRVATP